MEMQGPERRYLGAVSLNNSAVLLVERGCPRQAMTVLRDAMFAMRDASEEDAPSGGEAPGGDRNDLPPLPKATQGSGGGLKKAILGLDGMLRRASRFVIASAPAEAAAPAGQGPPSLRLGVESKVLDVDAPRLLMMSTSSEQGAPEAALALIRIDATQLGDFSVAEGDDETSPCKSWTAGPGLESITILHNFAVAALLLPPSELGLRRSAANVTSIAFDFAMETLRDDEVPGGGPFASGALVRLSEMLALCCYRLYVDLGDASRARASLGHFRELREAVADEAGRVGAWEGLGIPHAKAA